MSVYILGAFDLCRELRDQLSDVECASFQRYSEQNGKLRECSIDCISFRKDSLLGGIIPGRPKNDLTHRWGLSPTPQPLFAASFDRLRFSISIVTKNNCASYVQYSESFVKDIHCLVWCSTWLASSQQAQWTGDQHARA